MVAWLYREERKREEGEGIAALVDHERIRKGEDVVRAATDVKATNRGVWFKRVLGDDEAGEKEKFLGYWTHWLGDRFKAQLRLYPRASLRRSITQPFSTPSLIRR